MPLRRRGIPFLAFRELEVAGLPARVGRISFTGELGYEIWVTADDELALYDALVAAGSDLGLVHFGARALNSLRFEKSFGTWAREYRPIYTATEAGLDRFVALNKGAFVGSEAALREREGGGTYRLVSFEVKGGGFDWFGYPPANRTLTAYGLIEFQDMAKVHDVDPKLIERTRKWLLDCRKADGSWQPEGHVPHGLPDAALSATAYIAWAVFSGPTTAAESRPTRGSGMATNGWCTPD